MLQILCKHSAGRLSKWSINITQSVNATKGVIADTNRLNRLIGRASDVVGVKLDSLTEVPERRMLSKLHVILDKVSHRLHNMLFSYRSTFSTRLITPKCTTERHRKSFLPVAIRLYNLELTRSVRHSESVGLPWTLNNVQ